MTLYPCLDSMDEEHKIDCSPSASRKYDWHYDDNDSPQVQI